MRRTLFGHQEQSLVPTQRFYALGITETLFIVSYLEKRNYFNESRHQREQFLLSTLQIS